MDDQINDSLRPRLTRAEYWLLETAIEHGIALCFLNAERYGEQSSIELMFNKAGHGLACAELVSCLIGLFNRGLIAARRHDEEPCVLTEAQIVAALREERSESMLCYWLTEKGGAVWEAFAAPEWDRYICEDFDNETHSGKVTCPTRWRLEHYLDYLGLNLIEQTIDFKTIRIHEHGSWQATYWKRLPHGYTAEFSCNWEDREIPRDQLRWLAFSGFCEFRDEWYRWR